MNFNNYRSTRQTVAVSTTVTLTFGPDGLPRRGISAFHVALVATAGAFDAEDIDAIRVKVGGKTVIDLTVLQLRAYLERFTRSNRDPGATAARFTIPFYFPDEKGNRRREAALEPGDTSVELDFSTGAGVSGDVEVGWTLTDVAPKWYTRLIRTGHGHPASATLDERTRSFEGLIRAIIIPTTGLTFIRIVSASGVLIFEGSDQQYLEAQQNEGDMGLVEPLCHKFDEPLPSGEMKITASTGAGWTATGQLVGVMLIPAVVAPQNAA